MDDLAVCLAFVVGIDVFDPPVSLKGPERDGDTGSEGVEE
jgi:hypothetical protein